MKQENLVELANLSGGLETPSLQQTEKLQSLPG
jgi:hypothetical protein